MKVFFKHETQRGSRAMRERVGRKAAAAAFAAAAVLAPGLARAQSDLAVTITQGTANPVPTGAPVTYAVTARNIGAAQSSPVQVRLELPTSLTTPTASGSGFTCSSSTAGALRTFTCSSGVLPSNQSRSLSLSATAPGTITGDSQTLTVKALVNPNDLAREQGRTANNTATVSTVVQTLPDLAPSWAGSSTTASAGADLMFELALRNIGNRASGDAVLKVSIPVGQLNFSRFANNQFDGGCSAPDAQGKFTCRTASVPAGGSRRVNIWSRANSLLEGGDRLLSQATAELRIALPTPSGGRTAAAFQPLGTSERNERNNTSSLVTTVSPSVDLQVELARSRVFSCGDRRTVELVYRVSNRGSGTTTRNTQLQIARSSACGLNAYLQDAPLGCVCLTSTLPEHHAQNCSFGAASQTCPINTLAAGATREFTLYVEGAAGQNSVQVQATVDPNNVLPESNEQNNRITTTHPL
ncbi:MAG: hypothetical protein IPM15_04990 [Betaproteobacteria bacterium]|nr:hypothetical protein [Betaproteobacteria bacterium]MCC6247784.1 hypothetical protein [Rubrivivax sp.]MCL4695632.1 hypothetical protein [Burkholderiaceae bacterium]NUP87679.1 hypothetical protein [Burkholderiaceae bacterium]